LSAVWPDGVVVREAEPGERHSPWRVGGSCAWFAVLHRRATLADGWSALRQAGGAPMPLGAGTRTLVRGGGLDRPLARLGVDFLHIERGEGPWFVGAAVPVPVLLHAWALAGRTGLEAWTSLAGSVGAAVALDSAGVLPAIGAVEALQRGQLREGTLEDAKRALIITGVWLRSAPAEVLPKKAKARSTLPQGWWQRDGRIDPVAELVRAGVAGTRLRDVRIPSEDIEQFVNTGRATLDDVELLARSVCDKVKRTSGDDLVSRVQEVGKKRRS